MAIMTIPDDETQVSDPERVAALLARHGILYETWSVEGRVEAGDSLEAILSYYQPELSRLKERGGYVTADVIDVTAGTPGLEAMLEMFSKEHTHSEDEVRFVVSGRGIFHIHPETGLVLAIEMQAGDLINVPAGTRHWFNLCADRRIRAIRLFKDKSGWTPYYVENGIHGRYQPLCFGLTHIPGKKGIKAVIQP